jgi:hypothetical protein
MPFQFYKNFLVGHTTIEFRGLQILNPALIVTENCYAPAEDKSEEVKNAFYDELDRICDELPPGKPKIIIGD